jgi:hypothetical protein
MQIRTIDGRVVSASQRKDRVWPPRSLQEPPDAQRLPAQRWRQHRAGYAARSQ